MLGSSTEIQKDDIGIIILGNAGAGKSFLGNLILGEGTFPVGFQPDAVTRITQYQRVSNGALTLLIYDIPGLIEIDQTRIDENKAQINKAFAQCPKSLVLFVWRQFNGRAVHEDMIAFEALKKAFEFPHESLLHVVNSLSVTRTPTYEAIFMIRLSKMLNGMEISRKNMLFIDALDPANEERKQESRMKVFGFLRNGEPHDQKKDGKIILQLDTMQHLMETMKTREEQHKKEIEAMEELIQGVAEQSHSAMRVAQTKYEQIRLLIDKVRKEEEESRRSGSKQDKMESLYNEHMKMRAQLVKEYNQVKQESEEARLGLFGNADSNAFLIDQTEDWYQVRLDQLKRAFIRDIQNVVDEHRSSCQIS